MQFSQQQIDLAKELGRLRLSWSPAIGHYVYDERGELASGSPTQNRVVLIGDAAALQQIASRQQLKHDLVWLPTWHDAREILHWLDVSDADVELELVRRGAIADGRELLVLYEFIAQQLSDQRLRLIYRDESATQVEA